MSSTGSTRVSNSKWLIGLVLLLGVSAHVTLRWMKRQLMLVRVRGVSMLPTLAPGDALIARRLEATVCAAVTSSFFAIQMLRIVEATISRQGCMIVRMRPSG